MTTANIRQLQHNLAEVLRKVEAGEEVEILRRNRPIARIIPLHSELEHQVDWSSLDKWRARVFRRGKIQGKAVSALIAEGREERV